MKVYLHGLVNDEPSPFDNSWLVYYDPERYDDTTGMVCTIRATKRRDEAMTFTDFRAAIAYIQRPRGKRPDGKPDRPIAAYTMEFVKEGAPDPPDITTALQEQGRREG